MIDALARTIHRRGVVAAIIALIPVTGMAGKRPRDYCRTRDFPLTSANQCYLPGPACDDIHDGWCDEWRCAPPCVFDTSHYAGACWCTEVFEQQDGDRGYAICCDCLCPGDDRDGDRRCGCKKFKPV